MFRLVLECLAAGDLTSQICSVDPGLETEWSMPALITACGANLLVGVPPTAVDWLKHSAQRDVETLSSDMSNGLIAIVIKKRSFASFIDHHVIFPADGELKCVLQRSRQFTDIAAVSGDTAPVAIEYLGKVLRTALKDRITAISPRMTKFDTWTANQAPPTCESVKTGGIGIVLSRMESTNNSKTFRGVAADSPKAANFRTIWGAKSEERRFKDGSICVAAHFESDDPTRDAVEHLVKLHGAVSQVGYFGELDESLLKPNIAESKALSDAYR